MGWDGLTYAVVFAKNGNLHRVGVSRAGEITDRTVLASGREHHVDPEVSGSLIAWRVWTPCYTAEKVVAIVARLPGREPVLASVGNPVRIGAQAAAVGDTFATVWLDRTDLLRARARVGETVIELSDRAVKAAPAIANAGDRALIVFAESDESGYCGSHLVATLIDAEGNVLARTKIDERVFYFAVASDGTDFALIWTSFGSGKTALYAMQLDAAGKVIDHRPREVVSEQVPGPWLTWWIVPSITWTGSEYLVTWQRMQRNTGVLLQRLSRTLDPIESVRTLGDAIAPAADLAAGAASTLIVQRDGQGVSGVVLDRMGSIVAEPVFRAELPSFSLPAVAARGTEFIVVAGNEVMRVDGGGAAAQIATLPGEGRSSLELIPDRSVAVSSSRAQITYERGGEIFFRTLTFRVRSARSR